MPCTEKAIIYRQWQMSTTFSVPRQVFTDAFALATNLQIFHNCWHLQSKLTSHPPLVWYRTDLVKTTSLCGQFPVCQSTHILGFVWLSRITWSKSSLDYYTVWVSGNPLINRIHHDKCYLWPNKDLANCCEKLQVILNQYGTSIKGRIWI